MVARENAYAPYSSFRVGAAVRAGDRIYAGCNVENASYGLTMCAERAAVFAAVAAGERRIDAVAIVTGASEPTPPCGACRQVLREFGADPTAVTIVSATLDGRRTTHTLEQLLPAAFGPHNLS